MSNLTIPCLASLFVSFIIMTMTDNIWLAIIAATVVGYGVAAVQSHIAKTHTLD